jgi:hypothetical protein
MDKNKIREVVSEILTTKLSEVKKAIDNAQESANNDTKSSAGDKYETSRAMAQNDKAMFQVQLASITNEKVRFDTINFDQNFDTVRSGALLETSLGLLFFGVSLGKIVVEGSSLICISEASPLGKVLYQKTNNSEVTFNGKAIQISRIS